MLCLPEVLVRLGRTQSPPDTSVSTVVNHYCIGCHNSKVKAGSFVLDSILAAPVAQHSEEWEKVVRKLRVRHMPPIGLPRPDEKTYEAVIGRSPLNSTPRPPRIRTLAAPTPSGA